MVARHDRAQALLMAQLKARRIRKTYQALVQGSVSAAVVGDQHRSGATRSTAPGWPSSRRRPSITGYRVRERFDGWTSWSSTWSPGERTRSACTSTRSVTRLRATRVRDRDVPPGPRRLDRLFLHAWRLELASPTDGHLIRATAPLPPSSKGSRGDARCGGAPMTVRPPDRDGRRLDPYAGIDVSEDPGGPTSRSRGAGSDPGRHLRAVRRRQGHDHRCHASSRGRDRS